MAKMQPPQLTSVELFAGAGGLAMGVHLAGFKSVALVERDRWACETLRRNAHAGLPHLSGSAIHEADVREFQWHDLHQSIDLVAGGPPCQPFSLGGKHRASNDSRDMFPTAVDIVRTLNPKAFIFENVKGLTRQSFSEYFNYILLQLRFPSFGRRRDEEWREHSSRLSEHALREAPSSDIAYRVSVHLANAADYGVPQRRERVFIVGFRADLGIQWGFPQRTHSIEALLHEQYVTGEYWRRHGTRKPKVVSPQIARRVSALDMFSGLETLRWQTVRDAIADLPKAGKSDACGISNHVFQEGARTYPGHTGSPLDLPAKTLKAGDHGVPGGENMLVTDNGEVRYFTVREAARLQTFPDDFIFQGSWTETMRQLGNAVPVSLAHVVASSVSEALLQSNKEGTAHSSRKTPNSRARQQHTVQSSRESKSRGKRC